MLDFFLHLDEQLGGLINQYGPWIYLILFLTVFCETGLVVTPFLPGDTLLFAAGIFAHSDNGGLNIWFLYVIFMAGALAGDNVNYQIGRLLGKRLFRNPKSRFFKQENLAKTHAFMERHGPKAIILARFVPIVRTFCPFAAGMGTMTYRKFLFYSVVGAFLWVMICVTAGYQFGRIQFVKENFAVAILAIVAVTLLPVLFEWWRHRRRARREREAAPDSAAS